MNKVNLSLEKHIASAEDMVKAATMFVSGAEDAKTLKTVAENFIPAAEAHIAGAEALVSSSGKHIATAEDHLKQVTNFVGAEDKIPKKPKGSAS